MSESESQCRGASALGAKYHESRFCLCDLENERFSWKLRFSPKRHKQVSERFWNQNARRAPFFAPHALCGLPEKMIDISTKGFSKKIYDFSENDQISNEIQCSEISLMTNGSAWSSKKTAWAYFFCSVCSFVFSWDI